MGQLFLFWNIVFEKEVKRLEFSTRQFKMDLSIIVPAYNAEPYLKTCIKSLLNQDLGQYDYEIIVINDGSTDNTETIIKSLMLQNSNIKLINQKNIGLGGARNNGFNVAKGKYIHFMDADDYIAKNVLKKLLEIAFQNNLEILGFDSKEVVVDDLFESKNISEDKTIKIMNGIEFMGKYYFKPEVWWYLIQRDFFIKSDIRFYDRKYIQDSYFTPTLLRKATKMVYVDYDIYRYYRSANSITRNKSNEHLKIHFSDLAFAIEKQNEIIQSIEKANKEENNMCLHMLRVKKERYVLISIVRYIKSDFEFSRLWEDLILYKNLEAYPFRNFPKIKELNKLQNHFLAFIFNSKILLYLSFKSFRLLRLLKILN